MINAYVNYWKNYANFRDRARRADYWWAVLCQGIILTVLSIIMMTVTMGAIMSGRSMGGFAILISLVTVVFSLASIIPTLSLAIRRLHDTGRSGWWYLIAFVPMVGGIALFVFMCLAGTPGDNQYGSDPKAI